MSRGAGRHARVAALPTLLLLLLLLAPSLASATDPRKGASASLSVGPGGSVTWKKNGTFPLPYGVSVTTPNDTASPGPGRAALVELKAAIDAYAALLASDAAALEAAKINHDAKAGIRLALASHASGYAAAKARAKAAVAAALANAVPGARCPNGTVAVPVELKKVLAAKAPEVTVSVVVGSNKTSLLARAAAGLASAKAALLNATATNGVPPVPGRRRARSLSGAEGASDDARVVAEDAVARAALDPEALLSAETDDEAAAEAALVEDEEDFAAFRVTSSDDPEGLLEDVASAYASSLLSVGKSPSPTAKKSSVAEKFWGALTTIAPNAQADAASSGAICVVPQCLLPGGSKLAASAAAKGAGCSCAAGYGSVSPWDLKAVAWAEALAAFTAASGKNLSSAKAGLVAGKNLTAAASRLQQKQMSLWGFQPGSLSLPGLPLPWASKNSSLWKWKADGAPAAVKVARLPAVDVEAKKLAAASLASNASSLGKEAAAGLLATLKQCGECPPGWASAGGVGAKCVKCPGGGTCNKCAPGTGFSLDSGFCDPTGLYPTCPTCTCDPRTCSAAKAQCGAAPNGCSGSTPDCGTCSGTLSCDLGSNLCSCAVGQSPPLNATSTTLATSCLTVTGGACAQGSACLSGRCAASSCVSSCPSGSSPAASTGSCQCDATFYGAGGAAPCTACGGGSTSTAGSSTSCSCPAPSTWGSSTNACTCPNALQTFVTGNCLGSPTAACTAGKQCLSAECSASVAGQCVSSCPPNSSDLSSSGLCSCNPGYFSSTGQAGCVKCVTGSTSSAYGSTSCSCSTPTGAVWNATTNSCACPAGKTNVNGACLVVNGGPCSFSTQCASGICDVGQCVAQCPTGSVLNGGTSDCECTSGYYNPSSGSTPCTACGGGSTSTGTLTTVCTCSGTGTWNSATNSCACLAGQTYVAAAATCLNDLGQTCATDANCVSGVCSGFVCSSTCAPNSSDRAGFCRCNPGYFDLLNGVPPCTACPAGSSSSIQGYGSQGCVCQSPTGSVWDSATNSCLCPAGKQLVGGACLSSNGQSCSAGTRCASGLCSSSQCVASCPAGSTNNGGGGCTCDPGYFNPVDGLTPCVACGGGSTSSGIAQQVCTCPVGSGATWSAATNTCVCTDPNRGFVSSSGTCLLKNNQACRLGQRLRQRDVLVGRLRRDVPGPVGARRQRQLHVHGEHVLQLQRPAPLHGLSRRRDIRRRLDVVLVPCAVRLGPADRHVRVSLGHDARRRAVPLGRGQLCSSGSQCASGLCANDFPEDRGRRQGLRVVVSSPAVDRDRVGGLPVCRRLVRPRRDFLPAALRSWVDDSSARGVRVLVSSGERRDVVEDDQRVRLRSRKRLCQGEVREERRRDVHVGHQCLSRRVQPAASVSALAPRARATRPAPAYATPTFSARRGSPRVHRLSPGGRVLARGERLVQLHSADGLLVGRRVQHVRVPGRHAADARRLDRRVPALGRTALSGWFRLLFRPLRVHQLDGLVADVRGVVPGGIRPGRRRRLLVRARFLQQLGQVALHPCGGGSSTSSAGSSSCSVPRLHERMGPSCQRLCVPSGTGILPRRGDLPQRQRPELRDGSELRQQRVLFPLSTARAPRPAARSPTPPTYFRADVRVQPRRVRSGRGTSVHEVRRRVDGAAGPGRPRARASRPRAPRGTPRQHVPLPARHARRERRLPQGQRPDVLRRGHLPFRTLQRRRVRPVVSRRHRSLRWAVHLSCRSGQVLRILRGHEHGPSELRELRVRLQQKIYSAPETSASRVSAR